MAIIKFTQADKLSSLIAEPGWYPLTLAELSSPTASGSGKSLNFYATFKVIGGPLEGKEFKASYNTGMKNASMLNGMTYMPHTFLIPLYAAAFGIERSAVPDDFDTDVLVGKHMDGKIEKGIYDGIPGNMIIGFLPEGKGKDATVPF